ncbi:MULTISPECIES: EAL domain-containing protein [Protofrankia]|uniref:Diguanylate phosphodiesterase n=1 Tax=Candidatus Protofrankia datiscae TaxID=2716812 RepID=F8B382_9ACTN|nr:MULTISPECIES: EAL domain-containing protein [Protofrankia]AEH10882.1 diguanylate phosphodiesterase [Candidatus Protofrankia datiscae]
MTAIELNLVPALCAAFDDGSLQLHYQPEVDLRTGSVPGMEAFLRWHHPDRGLMNPSQFMPAAAAAGLSDQVGRWVLRTAVAEARTWHEMAAGTAIRPPRLWVNVTADQLTRPGFAIEVEQLMHGRALPPGALGLEFTEQTLGLARVGVPRLLARLRSFGPAIGVDGFGTWYASLSTLDVLPLDMVKIDGCFLHAMQRDLEGEAVLASIITLAHRRQMVVTAEGVDSVVTASRLAAMHCDRGAGLLFCPPVPTDDARMIALGRGRPNRRHGRSRPTGATSGTGRAGRAAPDRATATATATGTIPRPAPAAVI